MLQNLHGGGFGLGGGNIQPEPPVFQIAQQGGNPGVGEIFKFSNGEISASEDGDGFFRFFRRDAKFDKGFGQRRTDKNAQRVPVLNGDAIVIQRQLGAFHDSLAGVGQRSVQIK